jgi:transposase
MNDLEQVDLDSRTIGALPVIERFFERLKLGRLLQQFLPERKLGRRPKLSIAKTLRVMLSNILISRLPLYAVSRWAAGHVPEPLGLREGQHRLLDDDRIGRALDQLYKADRASLATSLVAQAVREFALRLEQLHSDTTTVTFCGRYSDQKDKQETRRPPLITFGKNKDHRPDLKQLVYELTITSDGAVPVHHGIYDGNTSDSSIHEVTWEALCAFRGSANFLYVGDCKLCNQSLMNRIHSREGKFLTVLPRNRREEGWFRREYLAHQAVAWEEVRRDYSRANLDEPDRVFEACESPQRSVEGFRIVWYRDSSKLIHDQIERHERIQRARQKIENLRSRTGRHRLRSVESAQNLANQVLDRTGTEKWLRVTILADSDAEYRQEQKGRPGKDTRYRRVETTYLHFLVSEQEDAIELDACSDGCFPLITNCEDLSARELLDIYKYQPFVEKRNEQFKSVLDVAPVFLKRPERISALLFLYFLAMLISALIERELRRQMADQGFQSLPLYPEERMCSSPTTSVVLDALEGIRRHHLLDETGEVLRTFYDSVPDVLQTALALLNVNLGAYGISLK